MRPRCTVVWSSRVRKEFIASPMVESGLVSWPSSERMLRLYSMQTSFTKLTQHTTEAVSVVSSG
jgi:hypothetical protein